MKKISRLILIIAAAALFLAGCGETSVEKSGKPVVYTSFYAMNDFALTVGGDDIELYNIAPSGTEPHDFEPTASDMARLSEADIFIYNGAGMEHWAEDIADTLPETVTAVCASDAVEVTDADPHVWLNLENAKLQLQLICAALSEADSENADNYSQRTADYIAQIDAVKAEYENAGLSGKRLFVTHGAYSYLCDEFGMEQTALEGISGDSDPSPAQMAKIVDEIKAEGAKCIFYDPLDGDKTANAVAAEAGIEALPLYTFEGDGEGRDYVTVMKENLEQLKKGI